MPVKHHLLAVVVLCGGAAALGAAVAGRLADRQNVPVGAVIRNAEGRDVGSLRVQDTGRHKARLTVNVRRLPPGYHGFHIHAKGVCDAKSRDPRTGGPFFSAGPHLDVDSHSHPQHAGDLPPLLVGADGTGHTTIVTDRFQTRRLLTGDGSAIVIHARPDNQAEIPQRYSASGRPGPDAETGKTGDSGARIACGVIGRR